MGPLRMAATCHAWLARVVAALPPPPELPMPRLHPQCQPNSSLVQGPSRRAQLQLIRWRLPLPRHTTELAPSTSESPDVGDASPPRRIYLMGSPTHHSHDHHQRIVASYPCPNQAHMWLTCAWTGQRHTIHAMSAKTLFPKCYGPKWHT
jgi:hypothetical protein